jgi:hypothetical protein
MVELPTNLFLDGFWPVRIGNGSGFCCIGGGTECVRAHVADGGSLTGGSGGSRCCTARYISCTDATDKPATNSLGSGQFSPGVRPGSSDESPRAAIMWRLSLK